MEQLLQLSVDAHLSLSFNLFSSQCVNRSSVPNSDGELDISFTEFEQNNESVWTLFFQFPALAYLDPARKVALLSIVLNTLNLEAAPNRDNPPNSLDDLCIGTFEFYELTTFRERYGQQTS